MTTGVIRRGKIPGKTLLGSVGVAALAVIVWQLVSGMTFVVPSPGDTVSALLRDLGDRNYLLNLQYTFVAAFWAFVIGSAAGFLLGLGLGLFRWAQIVFEPIITALNGLPKIILYPVLLPVFGLSISSKIAMGVLFALFPVLVNVAIGSRNVPAVYRKLARSVNASGPQRLWYVILPAIRRPAIAGLRLATSLALVGVVLAEFFATKFGLGRVVLQSYSAGQYADMMATILLLILVSFVLSVLLWWWERRMR
ncbi:ABC transporter permease [Amycolatopsis taiwanensis]|uniref:ABC transporter permease n=1 Tax=Amycolatopsis taiwanensis TaxID=342230 RepID=A0A9W6R2U4_9PSEU|nr:ABC transporter permease subunit [Amycolatopsis taiwanensis]GLY68114.1 ABC transporter permease [Amycolatopsis taiwanensis]